MCGMIFAKRSLSAPFWYSYDMKTVLFVPGFREDLQSRDYKSVLEAIKSKGYAVVFVPINWKRTVVNAWTRQLEEEYNKHDPRNTILAGFSYGSLTAFVVATKCIPAELWLFSLSPYFSDDIPKLKPTWLDIIGKRRTEAFRQLNFEALAKTIKCKTLIFVGEFEAEKYPPIGRRAKLAEKLIKDARLYNVAGAGHDVGDSNYVAAIKSAL